MNLIPIKGSPDDFPAQLNVPNFGDIIHMTFDFYERTGFTEPWIGYLAEENGLYTGTGGFKGRPANGIVEIAYATFDAHQNKGTGTAICRLLVALAQTTDPILKITARTLPEENYSTRILQKNGFIFTGNIMDPEDGTVWEWMFIPS